MLWILGSEGRNQCLGHVAGEFVSVEKSTEEMESTGFHIICDLAYYHWPSCSIIADTNLLLQC